MRAILFSDIHADGVTASRPRLGDVASSLDQVLAAAKADARCTHAFFLGDACDPDSGSIVFRAMEQLVRVAVGFENLGIQFWAIAGNHDVIEDGSGSTTLAPLRALGTCTVFERPHVFSVGDLAFCALPFAASSHAYDPAEIAADFAKMMRKQRLGIVLSHLNVAGIGPGSESADMARGRKVTLPYDALCEAAGGKPLVLLQGHYHERQEFIPKGGKVPVRVIGALDRFTFGEEEHTPGYSFLEVP